MNATKVSTELHANYKNYYEDGESEWRRLGAIHKANNIITLCDELPISTLLEIGAGDGSILKQLSKQSFGDIYSALEISETGVETIKARGIPQLRDCNSFDGYEIPYDENSFDLAILSHVVEHVEFPRTLLYEARRVAKYVLVEVPLEDTSRLPQDFTFNKVGHINFYSPKTIRVLLQTCGFLVLKQKISNPSKALFLYQYGKKGLINYHVKETLLKLAPRLSTSIFTYHSTVLCASNKNGTT